MKFEKSNTISLIIILEILAIIGALPLIPRYSISGYLAGRQALWTANPLAFIAFLAIVLAGILLYTRHESIKLRVCAVFIVIGLLLLTIFLIMFAVWALA